MLYCQVPAIKAMDGAALSSLTACEHLSLSTNVIDKMASLGGMPNLRVLSVGRNGIKKIDKVAGRRGVKTTSATTARRGTHRSPPLHKLEDVSGTLEELWISYNKIKVKQGVGVGGGRETQERAGTDGRGHVVTACVILGVVVAWAGVQRPPCVCSRCYTLVRRRYITLPLPLPPQTLDGLGAMDNLTTLYISNNEIEDWAEL